MIVLANTEAAAGIGPALAALKAGQPVLDALVHGIGFVEADPEVRSVGYGGWPNLLGEMECDGAVMDGATRRVGSVAAVPDTLHVAALAKAVMEQLPHVMLTGAGARRFADEIGMPKAGMLHPNSAEVWRRKMREVTDDLLDNGFENSPLTPYLHVITDPERVRDTTVFLGCDHKRQTGVATSTSGWAWKFPGRVGDSPIPGSGFYADSRFGAAACTHTGEMTLRSATSFRVVHGLEMGLSLRDAMAAAAQDLMELDTGFIGEVVIHAITPDDDHLVLQVRGAKPVSYWLWTEDMDRPARFEAERFSA